MTGWVTELAVCYVADQGLRSADAQGWLSPEQLAELGRRQHGAHGFVIRRLHEDNGNHWPDLKQLDCNGQFHLAVLIAHQYGDHQWLGKNQAALLADYYGHLRRLTKQEPKLLGIYAILRDKMRVASGRPQIYGTQFGQPTPPIQREDTIDQRRARVGLESLALYRARIGLAK